MVFHPVATRYDRLAGNYLAFVQLASIRLLQLRPRTSPQWGEAQIASHCGMRHLVEGRFR
jgi:hypothetical protein